MFYGLQVYADSSLYTEKQVRFPRSKKRRIRKKWLRQKKNWKTEYTAYRMGNNLFAHPKVIEEIRRQLTSI